MGPIRSRGRLLNAKVGVEQATTARLDLPACFKRHVLPAQMAMPMLLVRISVPPAKGDCKSMLLPNTPHRKVPKLVFVLAKLLVQQVNSVRMENENAR